MLIASSTQEGPLLSSRYDVHLKVEVKNLAGAWVDYSTRFTEDLQYRCEITKDVNQRVAQATIELARQSGSNTLAPLMNSDIAVHRECRISAARTLRGVAPAGFYFPLFQGRIDEWGHPEVSGETDTNRINLVARDGLGALADRMVEEERVYSETSGLLIEDVIQALLDDWADGVVLHVPVGSGTDAGPFTQRVVSVLDAVQALADTIGWVVDWQYSQGAAAWQLTFHEPARDSSAVDWTFDPGQYKSVASLKLGIYNIRNVVSVEYLDAMTNVRDIYTATDATSVTAYGRRWMQLVEADDSPINSAARAAVMADAAVSDLAQPVADQEVVAPLFPLVEVGDRYAFEPNGVHYDAEQHLGVTGYIHVLENGEGWTTLRTRGKPTGTVRGWLRREVRHRRTPDVVDCLPIIDEDDGVWDLFTNRTAGARAVYYTVTDDGSEPPDPVGADEPGGPIGTLTTEDREPEIATTYGVTTTVRLKAKATQNADGTGLVGPVREALGTFHVGENRPQVSWFPYVPADATMEGVRFVARDDSALVNFGYAIITDGDPEPSWPGDFALSGLVADPVTVDVPVTRPAEGDPDQLLYYQAVDAAGNLAFDQPQIIRVDSDAQPTGWLETPTPDAGAIPQIIVLTDDSDTGSYRLRIAQVPAGNENFPTIGFDDSDPDEISGTNFGELITLLDALPSGEVVNISYQFYRTTDPSAAAQEASIASPVLTAQIRPSSGTSAPNGITLVDSFWSPWDGVPSTPEYFWKYVVNLLPGVNVLSAHVAVTWDSSVFEYDLNFAEPGVSELHEIGDNPSPPPLGFQGDTSLHLVITPYDGPDGEAGSGVAGPPLEFDTGPAEASATGTKVEDRDEVQALTDVLVFGAATVAQPDAVTGRTRVGFLVDASVFGVKANGTDMTAKLANAIAYAAALTGVGKGGARVVLPDGIVWATQVRMRTRVSLESGFAWNSEVKQLANQHTVISTGAVTARTVGTLSNSGAAWIVNEHVGRTVRVTVGTGAGQARRVLSNTLTQLVIEDMDPWVTLPGVGATYVIYEPKHFVVLDSGTDTEHTRMEHVSFDGNAANQLALNNTIHYDQDDGGSPAFETNDPIHVLNDVKVRNAAGNGYYVARACRQSIFMNCHAQICGMWGFEFRATDNTCDGLVASDCRLDGFRADDWGTHWTACKAFGNRYGWLLSQGYSDLHGCWAQENKKDGFHFLNAHEYTLSACVADKNGTDGDTYSAGFTFEEATPGATTGNVLKGCIAMCTPGGAFGATQKHGVNNGAGSGSGRVCRGNWIEVSCRNQTMGDTVGAFEGNTLVILSSDYFDNNRYAEIVTDKLILRSGVVGESDNTEHMGFGREGSPSSGNPMFLLKTTDDPVPKGVVLGWDLSDAKTFLLLDFENDLLELGGGVSVVRVHPDATFEVASIDVTSAADARVTVTAGGASGGADVRIVNSAATTPYDWMLQGVAATGTFRLYENVGGASRFEVTQAGAVKVPVSLGIGGAPGAGNLVRITGVATSASGASFGGVFYDAAFTAGANGDSFRGMHYGPTIARGTFTALQYIGWYIGTPTLTGSGSIAGAYQFYIDAPPSAADPWSLYVNAGKTYFGGTVSFASNVITDLGVVGTVIVTTASEAFRWGKSGMGGAGNPYYTLKHGNESSPIALIASWDGTNAYTFMKFDHGNTKLILGDSALSKIEVIGHLRWPTSATYDIGAFGATMPRHLYMSGALTAGLGGYFSAGPVVSESTNEGFRWGKNASMGAAGNPYYTFKHDNGGSIKASVSSWDGTTAIEFFRMDHAGNQLDLMPGGGDVVVTGQIKIGNSLNNVSPLLPNRTVTIVVGGTTVYLHAKTTND